MMRVANKKIIVFIQFVIILQIFLQSNAMPLESRGMNLLDKSLIWRPFGHTLISHSNNTLYLIVVTNSQDKEFNRAYLETEVNSTKPLLLLVSFTSHSHKGKADFSAEIRENDANRRYLWGAVLGNTYGNISENSFQLPKTIANKNIDLRFYIITDEPGEHSLKITNATLIPR